MRMLVVDHGPGDPEVVLHTQLVDSLRFLGHEVVTADMTGDRDADVDRLSVALARFTPDVLVNVPMVGSLDGHTIRELTAVTETVAVCVHRGPSCLAAPTDLARIGEDLLDYDLVAVPDTETLARYLAEGTFRLSLFPPAVHVPALSGVVVTERRGVVVVGDADPRNIDLVSALDVLDDVVVVGRGWDSLPLNVHSSSTTDVVQRGTLFAGARLLVELPAPLAHQSAVGCHHSELGLSDAVLQAAAVGTPSVVLDRPGVAELLEPGVEVLTCETIDDLISLVPMLLASPDDLALIGDAAWHCVTSQHTWSIRWDALFAQWVDPREADSGEDVRLVSVAQDEVRAQA